MDYTFTSCLEVTEEEISRALSPAQDLSTPPPRVRVLALLRRMFDVAEPGRGAPRILLVVARLAQCTWLEGTLVVRLRAESESTTRIELIADDGFSPERLCPAAVIKAQLGEFQYAISRKPERVLPMVVESNTEALLVMRADPDAVAGHSGLGVANESLLAPERQARPAVNNPTIEWSRSTRPGAAPSGPSPRTTTASVFGPNPVARIQTTSVLAPNPIALVREEPLQVPPPAPSATPVVPPEVPPEEPEVEAPPRSARNITTPGNTTTRMPAQQAAELVARIRLKKLSSGEGSE